MGSLEMETGPRSTLLVDKHAAYIASFSKLWEVSSGQMFSPLLCPVTPALGHEACTQQQELRV